MKIVLSPVDLTDPIKKHLYCRLINNRSGAYAAEIVQCFHAATFDFTGFIDVWGVCEI